MMHKFLTHPFVHFQNKNTANYAESLNNLGVKYTTSTSKVQVCHSRVAKKKKESECLTEH